MVSQIETAGFNALYQSAHQAGMEAVAKLQVTPMVVTQHSDPLNDASPVQKAWYVADGVCGFAWVVVKPATSKFARWLKAQKLARSAYGGGLQIWVSAFNQSMQKKEAYAGAFAAVLRSAGIDAWADSRMD